MKIFFAFFFMLSSVIIFAGCFENSVTPPVEEKTFLRAVDISSLPEIEAEGTVFFDSSGSPSDLLSILKNSGCNAARVRIWHSPASGHSSLAEVRTLAARVKAAGMKVWLDIHYSDTWADPGSQAPPASWQNLSLQVLADSISAYTKTLLQEIQPDFVQVGNEINPGFLLPYGSIQKPEDFRTLLSAGTSAVRQTLPNCKIILHYAGYSGAEWFFGVVSEIDYDIIGISYYPWWHGKNLDSLETALAALSAAFDKPVLIAETAYPFTLLWNDWTNNIIGLESSLIPGFPASPEGQSEFLCSIRQISKRIPNSFGFCYWGAELVAFRGTQSTAGSPWENLALFDFSSKALPALKWFAP